MTDLPDQIKHTFDLDAAITRLKRAIQATNTDQYIQQLKERQQQVFEYAIYETAKNEFGKRYVETHNPNKVTAKQAVDKLIQDTVLYDKGFYFSGIPGSGKSHILLEYYYQLLRFHFNKIQQDARATDDYPQSYHGWIRKTVKYYYSSWITEAIRNRERLIVAKYNLIDDFFVEELSGYILAGWNSYIEEINRQGCIMLITSNVKLQTIKDYPQYARILSRIRGNCKVLETATKDRRMEE
jgi:DNA replication protein DnaC